ncbi:MAG: thioredoxin-disulfide reductase [Coriobacteriales bacterium]|nr:thioredoxin-disulfide reductase [Coriobacteriales bacterium]
MGEQKVYDLVIVGGGPAGLSAAIYAQRALLDTVTLEQEAVGGQVILTSEVDNYPGVPHTDGFTLVDAMQSQAVDLGANIVMENAERITRDEETGLFEVSTPMATYVTKTVIVAGGATPRKAGFEGEERFGGRGVSYCATCDGMFYRGKQVFVIGGGNSACEEALFLTRFANKVTLVVRKDHLRAQASVGRQVEENEKITVRYLTSIVKVDGDQLLTSITFRNNVTGEETTETYDEGSFGVFVFVGRVPASELLGELVELDKQGYVITKDDMSTETPGLFAAGDVRQKPLRQIVTAAADGAIAATSVSAYLGHPVAG